MNYEMELEKQEQTKVENQLKFFFPVKDYKKVSNEEIRFRNVCKNQSIEEEQLLKMYNFHRAWTNIFFMCSTAVILFSLTQMFSQQNSIMFWGYFSACFIMVSQLVKHSLACATIKEQKKISLMKWFSYNEKLPLPIETINLR